MIDSSLVYNLIKDKVSIWDVHSDYFSSHQSQSKSFADEIVQERLKETIARRKPYLISEDFPFITANPDFLINDGQSGPVLAEVKSLDTKRTADLKEESKKLIFQLESALQVFKLKTGWIIPVGKISDGEVSHQIVDRMEVSCSNVLFKHRASVIRNYVNFLAKYFQSIYGRSLDGLMLESLRQLFDQRIPKRRIKRLYSSLEEIEAKSQQIKAEFEDHCPKSQTAQAPHGLMG